MSKTLLYICSVLLIILVPIWVLIVTPEILKLPSGYSQKANMVHTENNRFDINSNWSGKTIAISTSNISTQSFDDKKSNLVTQFMVESLTGETLFELNQNFIVDRKTRQNLSNKDIQGNVSVLFSPYPSRTKILFWPIELGAPTTVYYIGTEKVNGLSVYHYQTKDAVINDTAGFVDLPLVPEKYKALSRVNIDVYVEPKTGTIIDYEDSGTSYYADDKNTNIWDMDEWGNKYNEPTVSDRVKVAKSKINYVLFAQWIVPSIIVLGSLSFLLAGLLKKKKTTLKLDSPHP